MSITREFLGQNKPVNKKQPLVSVSVPTYQHKPYIRECLDGILGQKTNFAFEVILGEDESTDGTRDICKEYAINHKNIIRCYLRSRKDVIYIDGNPSGKFNGIENLKAARGKYIALCEGDDYWTDPYKLQKQVEYLENHPECSMCFHSAKIVYENGDKEPDIYVPPEKKEKFTIDELLNSNFICTCTIVFRKGLFGDFPRWYYDSAIGDWALSILNAVHGDIGYLDEVMAVYRVHSNGYWSGKDDTERRILLIQMIGNVNRHFSYKYNNIIRRRISHEYFKIAENYLNDGDRKNSRKYLSKSVILCPLNRKIPPIDLCATSFRLFFPSLYSLARRAKICISGVNNR